MLKFPFPVTHIELPEQVTEAISAVYEAGIPIAQVQHAER